MHRSAVLHPDVHLCHSLWWDLGDCGNGDDQFTPSPCSHAGGEYQRRVSILQHVSMFRVIEGDHAQDRSHVASETRSLCIFIHEGHSLTT